MHLLSCPGLMKTPDTENKCFFYPFDGQQGLLVWTLRVWLPLHCKSGCPSKFFEEWILTAPQKFSVSKLPLNAAFGAEFIIGNFFNLVESLYELSSSDSIKSFAKCVPIKLFQVGTKMLEAVQQ